MAFITRSFVCNKVIQAVSGFPIGGKGIKPSQILPLIKICSKKSPTIEYQIELNEENTPGKRSKKNISRQIIPLVGADLIEKIQLDDVVTSAYLDESSFPKVKLKVCNEKVVKEVLKLVCDRPDSFWKSSALFNITPKQKVIVEFSSPNIAKPFHMGHLRSTIVGNFISNLYEALGHDVIRINYLGDWGTQFGLLKYGFDYKNMSENDLEENPIRSLYELYVWINAEAEKSDDVITKAKEIFSLMEKGDKEHLKHWKLFRDLSIKDFTKVYQRLNLHFDEYHGESMYGLEHSRNVLAEMEEKGILKDLSDGRKVYISNEGSTPLTIVKSDGTTMYITRDISAAIHRQEHYKFDKMFYIVDNGQHEHFVSLKRILKDLDYKWVENIQHIKFGRIQGMSTRKGNAVFLEDVLNEARELMEAKQIESENTIFDDTNKSTEIADIVGTSALIIADLKRRRMKDYEFSWENMLQSNGETGARLQYAHCRLVRLERNCGVDFKNDAKLESLIEPDAIDLVRHIARFDEILFQTLEELESSILTRYLFDLSNSINKALKVLSVKGSPISTAEDRLKLFRASRLTLAAGMKVLGLSPLEQM